MSPLAKRVFLAGLCVLALVADAEPRRRALLVGINEYSSQASKALAGGRFQNLEGAVNDVELMRDLLRSVYKVKEAEIVVLTNQAAGRAAILNAIDQHLVAGAQSGDILFFYFSGHGSQVKNSLSEEADRLDESIVPADANDGVADIRDKELRRRFQPLLDRGARLTVILDSCHSGSGVRGLPRSAKTRFAPPDPRDVRDAYRGPTLEDGGALVLSAARDTDLAFETRGREGKRHGVFSWAWARAIRDAAPGEPAIDTFQRASARMALEQPEQVPVIAGNAEARFATFLGVRGDRQSDRVAVAVRSVESNGLVIIQGGWANGLTLESELRPATNPSSAVRLRVVALNGVSESAATVVTGSTDAIRSGSLLELVAWAPPQNRRLRVWVPHGDERVVSFARALAVAAKRSGLHCLEDPADGTANWIFRWDGESWESFDPERRGTRLGPSPDRKTMFRTLSRGMSLFVQIPVSRDINRRIAPESWAVERVERPDDADYILTGRLSRGRVEYAWVRPATDTRDRPQSTLPLRTDWHDGQKAGQVAAFLTEDLRRLQRIHLWQTLPSPPETQFNYRLGIRRQRDQMLITDRTLLAEELYGFVLRAVPGPRHNSAPRFVYVFMVDSHGRSVLIFPRGPIGSVENRFPRRNTSPAEISLGPDGSLIPQPPFGTDTYFLLSTEEALTNPWILEWDGVRTPDERGRTPLEHLILESMSGDRGVHLFPDSSQWSIERLSCTSVQRPRAQDLPVAGSR
ncbi:MAG TPA: caspase family protein [Thermoanaerobaculia bacterium]|nr:caspase family protein [Thermoanaerobaculia bacterium]